MLGRFPGCAAGPQAALLKAAVARGVNDLKVEESLGFHVCFFDFSSQKWNDVEWSLLYSKSQTSRRK